jgi:hypothetical protein
MPDRLNIEGLIKPCYMRCSKRIFKIDKDSQKVKYYDSLIKTCVKLSKSNRCQYYSNFNKKCVIVNYFFPPLFYAN